MTVPEIIRRLHTSLPQVKEWIDQFLGAHASRARTISTLGFTRLSACFPQELLERAKVVTVERVQFPPVERFGLPEFSEIHQMTFSGITFKDTFFVREDHASVEELHFHELVHIVQWSRLGVDKFLLAYGVGLLTGYEKNPLEQMAYVLERHFENGTLPPELMQVIEQGTDAIWRQVTSILQAPH